MRGRRFGSLLPALVMSWAVLSSRAAAAPNLATSGTPGSPLDYQAVLAHYDNGDFDRVAQNLETFIARHPAHSHDDSVFVAKHLAVVYSSNEATAEKGRQYMYRLVDLLPSSRLVDMYVKDERSRIFRKVREQFMARQHAMGVDTAGIVLPDSRVPVAQAAPAQLASTGPSVLPFASPTTTPSATQSAISSAMPGSPQEPGPEASASRAQERGYGNDPNMAPEGREAIRTVDPPPAPVAAFARTQPAPSGFRTPKPQRSSTRARLAAREAQGGLPLSQADVVTPAQRRKAPRTSYLFAGGAAFVAAAAVTYFVLSDSPGTKEKTYVVP